MMKEMEAIAVLILTWNGREQLERFLPSVVAHTPRPHEVIIVDNGSKDDTISWLAAHHPSLRVIRLVENLGFAEGYNEAIRQVEQPLVLLLNSDVEVTEGWLTPLSRAMEADEKLGAVQPKVRAYRSRNQFEYAGGSGGYMDALGYTFCRGRILDTVEVDAGQYDTEASIFWATGAAFLIRRALYERLGGLPKAYFAHFEEIDLCWRIHRAGHDIKVIPSSIVYHLGAATLKKSSPRKTVLNFRNSLAMMIRNHPGVLPTLGKVLMRLVLDGVAGVQFLLKGEGRHTLAIIQAHFQWYAWLPRLIKERQLLAKELPYQPTDQVWKRYWLLWQYFGKGHKIYSQLPK